MAYNRVGRFEELEKRFSNLDSKLKDSPEKEAISILHAMVHEEHRMIVQSQSGSPQAGGRPGETTLDDIANLYKSAPGMEGHAENNGLNAGEQAPDFTLMDAQGNKVSLSSYKGRNVVLVFYPLDWSPACSDQLSLYQSELTDFDRYNAQILAVSVDSIYSHGAWSAVRGITFPLLADFNPKGEVARKYKVYRNSDGFSERAIYVIDPQGKINYCYISPELHKIPDIYQLFEQLKTLNPNAANHPAR
jgi:peroxiredoxin